MPKMIPSYIMNGDCEAAVALYVRAFGARVLFTARYGETDPRFIADKCWENDPDYVYQPLTDEQRNLVWHMEVFLGGYRVVFSDSICGEVSYAGSPRMYLSFETEEELLMAYRVITEGCLDCTPVKTGGAYASAIAMVTDCYGLRWGLVCERK